MPRAAQISAVSDSNRPSTSEPAMRSLGAHLCLWITAAFTLWIDLATKHWAFHSLNPVEDRVLIPGFLSARRSLNSGALFGAFSGWVIVFICATLLAVGFVLYVFSTSHRRQRVLHVGLAFILAGALGNLYDRAFVKADVIWVHSQHGDRVEQDIGLVISEPDADPLILASYPEKEQPRDYSRSRLVDHTRQGVVRDFVKFTPIGGFDYWPWVFNVADALLVIGVGLLMLCFWRDRSRVHAASTGSDDKASST